MKYAIIIPDGCADEPQPTLDGKTPLQAAQIPRMDDVAKRGTVGRSNNVPPHLPAGSEVATLSLLGYDPDIAFTGRAPLEAAAQGIALGPADWALRCNLVCIEDGMMRSFTAGHIASDQAAALLHSAQAALHGDWPLQFCPGVSYRNLLVYRGATQPAPFGRESQATPPHDLTDKPIADDLPRGPGAELLRTLITRSAEIFADHPVNRARRAAGKLPATHIWLWGLGHAPQLAPFATVYGKTGAMITAVDLLRGIASLIGWQRIEAPGATGYTDTDYASKGRCAVAALQTTDVVCVHIEAPDEASHEGDVKGKIKALEAIDQHIVGPVVDALKTYGQWRILISPDHPTPVRTKTHSHGIVPFAIAGSDIAPDAQTTYDECTAQAAPLAFTDGWRLMSHFIG